MIFKLYIISIFFIHDTFSPINKIAFALLNMCLTDPFVWCKANSIIIDQSNA